MTKRRTMGSHMSKKQLILIGAGGFAKSAISIFEENGAKIYALVDSYKTGSLFGYDIIAHDIASLAEALNENNKRLEDFDYFIAIGDRLAALSFYNEIIARGLGLSNCIANTAVISAHAGLGQGCFIGHFAMVNAAAILGDNVIINTRALIEHSCQIASHVNISTNVTLNGCVKIGSMSFIGSSSSVKNLVKIGENVTVGIDSLVLNDLESNGVYIGSPCKKLR